MNATIPPPPARTKTARLRRALAWTGLILLAFVFLSAGLPKLLGLPTPSGSVEDFARWGYPAWFRPLVGALETMGAVALLLPRPRVRGSTPRFLAALGLAMDMVGAAATHLAHGETAAAPIPLTLLALVVVVAWTARPAGWRRGARGAVVVEGAA